MYKKYTLEVTEQKSGASRTIEMDGGNTLDDLSNAILNAVNFDKSHLYMFSLSKKPYGEGYYHPMADLDDGDKSAADASLNSLGLRTRKKLLYVYDFGDDWHFDVTVKKVETVDAPCKTAVIASQGELTQYPEWDEEDPDWDEYEDEFLEDLDWDESEEDFSEDDFSDEGVKVRLVPEKDETIQKKLEKLPAICRRQWQILAEENMEEAEEMEPLAYSAVEKCGLVVAKDQKDGFFVDVKRGEMEPQEYPCMKELNNQIAMERSFQGLVSAYGVIERETLLAMAEQYGIGSRFSREEKEMCLNRLEEWEQMYSWKKDGQKYETTFLLPLAKGIQKKREEYPGWSYAEWDEESLRLILSGEGLGAFPICETFMKELVFRWGWDPEVAEQLLHMASVEITMGSSEKDLLKAMDPCMREYGCTSQEMKSIRGSLKELYQKLPSAVLRGHCWGEYERKAKGQMELFE